MYDYLIAEKYVHILEDPSTILNIDWTAPRTARYTLGAISLQTEKFLKQRPKQKPLKKYGLTSETKTGIKERSLQHQRFQETLHRKQHRQQLQSRLKRLAIN